MTTGFKRDAQGDYIDKRAADVLDYLIPWAGWLPNGDAISSSAWVIPAGITSSSPSVNASPLDIEGDGVTQAANTVAIIWLSGGTAGNTYEIKNRITTTAGRVKEQGFRLVVK